MAIPLIICKASRLRRSLILFAVLPTLHFLHLRVVVNPQLLTNYFLESNLKCEFKLFLFGPSILILREIELFAPHLSKGQVLAILGEPRFKERKLRFPGCAAELTQAEDIWFYEVAPHALVLLCFKGDHCILARRFTDAEGWEYAKWKTQQIQKFGGGQTPEQLESWLGPCFNEFPKHISDFLLVAGKKPLVKAKLSGLAGYFYLSCGSVIKLEMRNGRLVEAKNLTIFH